MQDDTLSCIQSLRVFFVDALHSKLPQAPPVAPKAQDATAAVLSYIRKQYTAYQLVMLQLLQCRKPYKVQLAAVMALMEATRAGKLLLSMLVTLFCFGYCLHGVEFCAIQWFNTAACSTYVNYSKFVA
jgi:hypothetical protein